MPCKLLIYPNADHLEIAIVVTARMIIIRIIEQQQSFSQSNSIPDALAGWRSTSLPCSAAKRSCTGTLAKALGLRVSTGLCFEILGTFPWEAP